MTRPSPALVLALALALALVLALARWQVPKSFLFYLYTSNQQLL